MMANRTAGDLAKFLGCALQGEADLEFERSGEPGGGGSRRSGLPRFHSPSGARDSIGRELCDYLARICPYQAKP